MKIAPVLLAFICSLLSACSSTKNSTSPKNAGRSYSKLFIIGNTADIEARVRLEKELAAAAGSKGYTAVKSIDVMPPSIREPKPPPKDEFVSQAKAAGCDAMFIIYYIREKDAVNYIPGAKFDGTDPWITGLVSAAMGYKGTVDGTSYKKSTSTPGRYKIERGFYIFSGLFDASSEEILYSEKSEMFDAADLASFSKDYMTGLVKHLEIKKIIMK